MILSDQAQRTAALDPTQSYIVQAPAGSGKTELLIQRFLKLLIAVPHAPEEILAVTFTRKAAAEMRDRILDALAWAQACTEPPVEAHEKCTWELARAVLARDEKCAWDLLTNVHRLKIVTIDALCAYIVTKMPILSHIGAMPEIIDDPDKLYQEAVEWLCTQSKATDPWSKALEQVWFHFDNRMDKIIYLLKKMLAKRDQWLPMLGRLTQERSLLRTSMSETLSRVITDHLSQLSEALSDDHWQALHGLLRYAAQQSMQSGVKSLIADCGENADIPGLSVDELSYWQGMATLLLTQKGEWRKKWTEKEGFPAKSSTKDKALQQEREAYKNAIMDVVADLQEEETLLRLLADVMHLPAPDITEDQAAFFQALGEILRVLVGSLQLVFQQRGQVDFIEMSLRALEALSHEGQPTDIALFLDHRLQHILIDEYQDTSFSQFQLFEKLVAEWQPNEGRSLFLVGDPMQSIYRFRGAEVSLFLWTQQYGLGPVRMKSLQLTQNFRSESKVVTWINQHCTRLFPEDADISLGAVPFTSAHSAQTGNDAAQVVCHPVFSSQNPAEHDETVVDIIRKATQQTPYPTIAVLARAKKHLLGIIQILKQHQIPFVAHEMDPFAARAHVVDFMSLITAMCDLNHKIAWYAVLRSPLVGLSLADLLALHAQFPEKPLWFSLIDFAQCADLSPAGKARLTRVVPVLRYWHAQQRRHSLHQWIRSLWLALGGPDIYPHERDQVDLEKAQAVIERCQFMDPITALPWIQERLAKAFTDAVHIPEQFQAQTTDKPPVVLMTIHKAKGLEFDVVIIPHAQSKPRHQEPELLLWTERKHENGMELLLATQRSHQADSDKLYDYISKQITYKQQYESVRLLYVALTRARTQVHIVGSCEPEINPPAQSFWGMLWPGIESEIQSQTSAHLKEGEALLLTSEKPTQTLVRLPEYWSLPPVFQEPVAHWLSEDLGSLPPNRPEKSDYQSRAIGTVFHRVMQYWSQQLLSLSDPLNQLKAPISLALRRFGFVGAALNDATVLILKAINNMRSDSQGQWILDPRHTDRRCEWALSRQWGKNLENMVIDTAFIDQDQTRWIVDYKITQADLNQPQHLAQEIERYTPQMKKYQKALEQIDGRKVRVALYFPLMPQWCEL